MELKQLKCHTVVIGAGSAGINAYKNAVLDNDDCIIIDNGPLGTTAQRSGELPVSLLMSAGMSLHSIDSLKECGITFQSAVKTDTSNVLSSLRTVRARATAEVLSFMYKIPEHRRIRGNAKFIDNHTLKVDDAYEITFETAVIATGSSPLVTYEQSRLKHILTTNEFFELEKLPQSVAIFGSSKIGLELGQALSYLGVDVAVFGQRKLWLLTDDSVLAVAHQILSSRFNLYVDTYITSMEDEIDESGYAIYYIDDRSFENYLHMQSVVAATDRIPNVGGLNLPAIGVKLKRTGSILTNTNTLQTSVDNIFAAGDVCHEEFLSSIAKAEGKIAGINAANYPNLKTMPKKVMVNMVFTDPVLAIVGRTLDQMREYARTTGDLFITTEVRLSQGQFRGLREDGGIVSIYTSIKTHQILGAELCAFKGDKIAQLLAFAMESNATVDQLADYPFFNMSAESTIALAAKEACARLNKGQTRKI